MRIFPAPGLTAPARWLLRPSRIHRDTTAQPVSRRIRLAVLIWSAACILTGLPAEVRAWPTPSVELYEPATKLWSDGENLLAPCYPDAATLLPDGRVLLTGCDDFFKRAQLYDPASGTWSYTPGMTSRLVHGATTLLSNGRVLVAGGSQSRDAELYDPVIGLWITTGSLGKGRENHTATLLKDGRVLVAGGFGSAVDRALSSAEMYDPATGNWSATGSLHAPRSGHQATLLPDGKVLVTGGYDDRIYNGYLASAELYDPATGMWTPVASMSSGRVGHTMTLLPNGKALVAGGYGATGPGNAELYEPENGMWRTTGGLRDARNSHAATLLGDGRVLVVGGWRVSFNVNEPSTLSSAELYDPATETWSIAANMNIARSSHGATLLLDGRVLVAGGEAPEGAYLRNISTRVRISPGNHAAIAGFIIDGVWKPADGITYSKNVVVRGIGPSLPLGSAVLADPVLELRNSSGDLLAQNDNWKINDANGESQESFIRDETHLAPTNDLESALATSLGNGAYTAILRDKNGAPGIGVVEVYERGPYLGGVFKNISTRGFVGTGDNVLIGGFIAGDIGANNTNVLVRALGPSVPLADALRDPTLEMHDSNGALLATNDNWKVDARTGQSQEAAIRVTGLPPNDDRESSVFQRVAPGSYTVVLRGKNNTTGIALVEVYHLQ